MNISTKLPNIQNVDILKHVGVSLDSDISWDNHVNDLCKKLSSAIFDLKRTSAVDSPKATKIVWHAFFAKAICSKE